MNTPDTGPATANVAQHTSTLNPPTSTTHTVGWKAGDVTTRQPQLHTLLLLRALLIKEM